MESPSCPFLEKPEPQQTSGNTPWGLGAHHRVCDGCGSGPKKRVHCDSGTDVHSEASPGAPGGESLAKHATSREAVTKEGPPPAVSVGSSAGTSLLAQPLGSREPDGVAGRWRGGCFPSAGGGHIPDSFSESRASAAPGDVRVTGSRARGGFLTTGRPPRSSWPQPA